jgi:hypothetical protein
MKTLIAAATLLALASPAFAYETCSGKLMQDSGHLYVSSEIDGEQVEGECRLPASQRNRVLQACRLNRPCTVVGVTKNTCGPDCTSVVKIISVFAGNID